DVREARRSYRARPVCGGSREGRRRRRRDLGARAPAAARRRPAAAEARAGRALFPPGVARGGSGVFRGRALVAQGYAGSARSRRPLHQVGQTMKPILFLVATLALATSLTAGPAAAKVGIASVVDGDPVGQPPGAELRVLRIGTDMIADEKV